MDLHTETQYNGKQRVGDMLFNYIARRIFRQFQPFRELPFSFCPDVYDTRSSVELLTGERVKDPLLNKLKIQVLKGKRS